MAPAGVYVAQDLWNIYASRYLSIVGLTVLLYDHSLTLGDEVRLIWQSRSSTPKWLFLILRYVVPVFVLIQLIQMSGMAEFSTKFCRVWFDISTFMGIITIAGGNFLVLLHLWNLWDRNPRLITWTLVLFVVTQAANIGCAIKIVMSIHNYVMFQPDPKLRMCAVSERLDLGMLWAPGVAFEVIIFITVLWNGLDRPRLKDEALASRLYRDGVLFFVMLFVLRVVNLTIGAIGALSLHQLMILFTWCATTLTVTRLVLNLRRMGERSELAFTFDELEEDDQSMTAITPSISSRI